MPNEATTRTTVLYNTTGLCGIGLFKYRYWTTADRQNLPHLTIVD